MAAQAKTVGRGWHPGGAQVVPNMVRAKPDKWKSP
jgi:hypothetical protein